VIHLTILSDEFEEMGSATIDGHDVTIDLFGDDLEDGLAEVAAYFNESKIDLMIDPEVWEDPSTPEYFTRRSNRNPSQLVVSGVRLVFGNHSH